MSARICQHGIKAMNCKPCEASRIKAYRMRKAIEIDTGIVDMPEASQRRAPNGSPLNKCSHGRYWSQPCKECDKTPAYRIMRHGK